MDVLLARRSHDHVGKGKARRQVEAQRLSLLDHVRDIIVDRKQVGELPPKQRFRITLEVFGKLTRNVGQGSEGVGLPEPATAAVLELVDEVERLARLRLQPKSDA